MKNYIKHITILLVSLMFTSCLVDDSAPSDNNDQGPNFVGFSTGSFNATATADGSTYDFVLPIEVNGPTFEDVTGEFTASISIDPSSTAVEGVHYQLPNKTVTVSSANNLISNLGFTVLTDGIEPPLAETPVLTLNISEVSSGQVVPNGRTGSIDINLLYLCSSELDGAYSVSVRYVRSSSGIDQTYTGSDIIDKTGDGQYRTRAAGHWEITGGPGAIGGTPGFDFVDVCDQITIPAQNLVNLYSNIVEGVSGSSSVNPDTGVITFTYTVCASDCREYFATYTPL